jgi:hypothetical protein
MRKRLLVIGIVAVLLLSAGLLVVGLTGFWGPAGPTYDHFPGGALVGYLPEDTAAVISLQPGELLQAPVVRQHFAGPLRAVLMHDRNLQSALRPLGLDLFRDLDSAQFLFAARDPFRPLVLLRGRFEPERFQLSPDRLKELRGGPGDRYRLFEAPKGGLTIAPVAETLAFSFSKKRLDTALDFAAGVTHGELKDSKMRELLARVNSDDQISMAVSFRRLGKVPRLADALMERLLRPVFDHADSVVGGVKFRDNARGWFRFRANKDSDADELARHLQGVIDLARGARFIPGLSNDWLTLAKLVAAAEVERDGMTVLLRLDLPGETLMMRGPTPPAAASATNVDAFPSSEGGHAL